MPNKSQLTSKTWTVWSSRVLFGKDVDLAEMCHSIARRKQFWKQKYHWRQYITFRQITHVLSKLYDIANYITDDVEEMDTLERLSLSQELADLCIVILDFLGAWEIFIPNQWLNERSSQFDRAYWSIMTNESAFKNLVKCCGIVAHNYRTNLLIYDANTEGAYQLIFDYCNFLCKEMDMSLTKTIMERCHDKLLKPRSYGIGLSK